MAEKLANVSAWWINMDGNANRPEFGAPQGFVAPRMSYAARKAPGLPKLKDSRMLNRIVRHDAEDSLEPDIDFVYADSDSFSAELAELYSYSENEEFLDNYNAFEQWAQRNRVKNSKWLSLSRDTQVALVLDLLDDFELFDRLRRQEAVRSCLYLLQGCFMEFDGGVANLQSAEVEILRAVRYNTYLLYELGALSALCTQLAMQVESPRHHNKDTSGGCYLSDSVDLRITLSAICIMIECLRRNPAKDLELSKGNKDLPETLERMVVLRDNAMAELGLPICGDQPLPLVLFNMVTKFCGGSAPHFPMRKVLLTLWKIILAWLGGWDDLKRLKLAKREAAGLPCQGYEDTLEVAKCMRAAPPPLMPQLGESIDGTPDISGLPRRAPPPPLAKRQMACLKTDEEVAEENEEFGDTDAVMANTEEKREAKEDDDAMDSTGEDQTDRSRSGEGVRAAVIPIRPRMRVGAISEDDDNNLPPEVTADEDNSQSGGGRPDSPRPFDLRKRQRSPSAELPLNPRTLPWSPKIRERDIEAFLEHERAKFFGFSLPNDRSSLAGLPRPIHESVKALEKHTYISLAELQMKREEDLHRYCFSQTEGAVEETPSEQLYRLLLPQLPHYMIALLKILLAAAPHSKAKTDVNIHILADLLTQPQGQESNDLEKNLLVTIDMARHKEVIVKAVSGILLLMLKHFKLNHVYQFEYVSQHLTFANCIPLILKFFDQNIVQYVQSRNDISVLNYPRILAYYAKEKVFPVPNVDNLEQQHYPATHQLKPNSQKLSAGYCLWRNLFSAINLLRLLNKLTKWKHSRMMMLVVFKSAPILKRSLRVRHILLQLYALKLLKMQAKYLGRQWRKNNMEIMSAIYSKVRHRLNDDWAYGNDTNAKPWDFQEEESTLRTNVERFNQRRYSELGIMSTSLMATSGVKGNQPNSGGVLDGNAGLFGTDNGNELQYSSARDPEFQPYDNNFLSVVGAKYELTERFKLNYEKWLEREVYKATIDWDQLLNVTKGCDLLSEGQNGTKVTRLDANQNSLQTQMSRA